MEEKKKKYEKPIVEIIEIQNEDILLDSVEASWNELEG